MTDDLRHRYFMALAEWALMYPIPAWSLAQGDAAKHLAEAWGRTCAQRVMDVRDEEMERLRERAERAEAAIVRCVASVKKINLSGECPPDPSEWQRGYWACVDRVVGSIEAPYVDAAIDAIKRERTRRG